MEKHSWVKDFSVAVTVCDTRGTILEMNEKACRTFEKYSGGNLLGADLFDCHPEPARTKLKELMKSRAANIYTIEKNGVKKLIYQAPWFSEGEFSGYVEMSLEIPFEVPNFVRK
ncbi:MAG: PAS domain-containing protein [Candidatus Wallbacteria bacterium]|nr:PAS domain-containing protein [Candidatus Wallbacteria bacterium]